MSDMKIAAIMRSGAFSPNHIGNDAAILNATVEQLRKRGCSVKVYTEEQLCQPDVVTEPCVINMCREKRSLDKLQKLEDEGRLVINSAYAIENCMRERMCRLLMAHAIPYPESMIVDTDEVVKGKLTRAGYTQCWIKRGDSYKMHKEDVSYARHAEEAQEVLQEYFLRGIRRAVVNKHVNGELVKFYGISGSAFFHWFYPFADDSRPAASGQEEHATKFDIAKLKELCNSAADVLGLKLWGGDCMITPEGSIILVDFNDWPSYASCRNEASVAIAKAVIKELKGMFNNRK